MQSLFKKPIARMDYLGNGNDRPLGSSSAHSATCDSFRALPHSALLLLLQLHEAKAERENNEAEESRIDLASAGFQV